MQLDILENSFILCVLSTLNGVQIWIQAVCFLIPNSVQKCCEPSHINHMVFHCVYCDHVEFEKKPAVRTLIKLKMYNIQFVGLLSFVMLCFAMLWQRRL